METLLSGFPVIVKQPVQWAEMDMHNHVNNVWFFRYIENARIAYYEKINKYEFESTTGVSFILASATCQYIAPLTYPDTVLAAARMETIGDDHAVHLIEAVPSLNSKLITLPFLSFDSNSRIGKILIMRAITSTSFISSFKSAN